MAKTKFIHEYQLWNDGDFHDNGFWEYSEEEIPQIGDLIQVENQYGGYHFHRVNKEDEFFEGEWDEVLREYYKKQTDKEYGWIDKDGIFYGCDYADHACCADACFGLSELEAEDAGIIKIFSEHKKLCWYLKPRLHMTKAQEDTLLTRGFDLEGDMF